MFATSFRPFAPLAVAAIATGLGVAWHYHLFGLGGAGLATGIGCLLNGTAAALGTSSFLKSWDQTNRLGQQNRQKDHYSRVFKVWNITWAKNKTIWAKSYIHLSRWRLHHRMRCIRSKAASCPRRNPGPFRKHISWAAKLPQEIYGCKKTCTMQIEKSLSSLSSNRKSMTFCLASCAFTTQARSSMVLPVHASPSNFWRRHL